MVKFDGFPLGYEVFAGNVHDARTLRTIVTTMEARHGVLGRVWITDRGMASAGNLAWLRQTGRRYIMAAPKSEPKAFAAALAEPDEWRTVQEGIEVKLARSPTGETVILCRSADRRNKERGIHHKFSQRIELALDCLSVRIAPLEEAPRSGDSEPADRPHPAEKPACWRPLRDHVGAGRLSGRVPPERRMQRRIR